MREASRQRSRLLCGAPGEKRIVRVCGKISTIHPTANVDTYRKINSHVRYQFRRWWQTKHKTRASGPHWYWSPWLEEAFGLLQLKWNPSRLLRPTA